MELLRITVLYLLLLGQGGRSVNKGHFTKYIFKEGDVVWYDDGKIVNIDDDDLLLNIKFQREVVAVMYKKVDSIEKVDLVENNLWEISESQKSNIEQLFSQTEDSDLGHVRVFSLQTLKPNQWLHTEVMDVIFTYIASTRNGTISFSHLVMNQQPSESVLQSQIQKISFDTNVIIIPVIRCSHWCSIVVYLKEKNVICLDSFYKTKKVDLFEKVFHLISIVIPDVDIEEWKLFQPYTLPPQVDGTS